MKNIILMKITGILTALAFCVTTVLSDTATGQIVRDVSVNEAIGPGVSEGIDPGAFSLPPNLGSVKDSYCALNGEKSARARPVVIHIQDAHCNYYAQIKIAEIIRYCRDNYGVNTVNLEGGAGEYDLSAFTDIADKEVRRSVADHFLKSGVINGAEYYSVTDPEKAFLWGIEDPELYVRNLKVYRDASARKNGTERALDLLDKALDGLKPGIYSDKLMEFDGFYARYKSGGIDLKGYAVYLLAVSRELGAETGGFMNISLLSRVIDAEKIINFKKANNERDELISLLEKKLSKREFRGIAHKTLLFKNGEMGQATFYGSLLDISRSAGVDVGGLFPELSRYIGYISMYAELDRSMLVKEMRAIEGAIREKLCVNGDDRELGELSMTLALLKNIFNFTLTREDWGYYREHKDDFNIANFRSFLGKHGALSGIDGSGDIDRLDGYRESVSEFFEYSFKRDETFIKNMRFQPEGGKPRENGAREMTIMITGGFHAENIWELFRSRGMDYVSIMPCFTSPEGYLNPYFDLLSGKKTGFIGEIMAALSAMQVASLWNSLGLGLDGNFAEFARAAVKALARVRETKEPFKLRASLRGKAQKDGWIVFGLNDQGDPECRFSSDDPGPGIKGNGKRVVKDVDGLIRVFEGTEDLPDAGKEETPGLTPEERTVKAKALVNKLTAISDRDERRKALSELREIGDNVLVLDTIKKEAGIEFDTGAEADYEAFGVDEAAKREVEKLPGLEKFLFSRKNLAKLGNLLSRFRMVYDYKDSVPNDVPYLKYAWDNGLAYCLTPDAEIKLWCSPASGSFRRHIFFVTEDGVIKDKLEIKISGEKPGKVDMTDVFGGWEITGEDKDEHVFQPFYKFDSEKTGAYPPSARFDLYNTRRDAFAFYLYKYEDGIRIEHEEKMIDLKIPGLDEIKIKRHLAKEIIKKVLFFHLRNRLVGTPVPEIPGIDHLSYAEQEERIEMGWLKQLIISNTDMHIENFKAIIDDMDILNGVPAGMTDEEALSKIKVKQVGDLQGFHGRTYTRKRSDMPWMGDRTESVGDECFDRMMDEEMWSMLLRLETVMFKGSTRETTKCFIDAVGEMGLAGEARRVYTNFYGHLIDPDAKVLVKWPGAPGAARDEDAGPSLIGKVTDDKGKICNRIAGIVTSGGIFKRLSVTMTSDTGTKTVHAGIIRDRRGVIAAGAKEARKAFLQKAEGQRQYLTEREAKALDSFKRWLAETNGYRIVPIGRSGIKGLIDHTTRTVYLAKNLADDPLALFHEWGELNIRLTVKDRGEVKQVSPHTVMRGAGKDIRKSFMEEHGETAGKGLVHIRNAIETRLISAYARDPGSISKYRGLRIRSGLSPITEDEGMLMRYNFLQGRRGVSLLRGFQDLLSPGTENDDLTEKAANKKGLAGAALAGTGSLINSVIMPLLGLLFMNNGVGMAVKARAFLKMVGVLALSPVISLARTFMPVNIYKKIVYALVLITLVGSLAHPIQGIYSPSFDPDPQAVTINLVVEETMPAVGGAEVKAMLEGLGKEYNIKITVDGDIGGEYTGNDMAELKERVQNATNGGKFDQITGDKATEVVIGENADGKGLEIKAIYANSVKRLMTETLTAYIKLMGDPEKAEGINEAQNEVVSAAEALDKDLAGHIKLLLSLMPDMETAMRNAPKLRRIARDINILLIDHGLFVIPMEFRNDDGEGGMELIIYSGKHTKEGNSRYSFQGERIDSSKNYRKGMGGLTIYMSNIGVVDMASCLREAGWVKKVHEEQLKELTGDATDEDKETRAYTNAVKQIVGLEFTDPRTGELENADVIAEKVGESDECHEDGHTERYGSVPGLPETAGPQAEDDETWGFLRQIEKGPIPCYSLVKLSEIMQDPSFKRFPHFKAARTILTMFAEGSGLKAFNPESIGDQARLLNALGERLKEENGRKNIRGMANRIWGVLYGIGRVEGKLPGVAGPSLIGKVMGKNGIVTRFDISEPVSGIIEFAGDDRVIKVRRSKDQGNFAKDLPGLIDSAMRGNNYLTEEEKALIKGLSAEIGYMEVVVIEDYDKDGDTLRGGIDRANKRIYLSESIVRSPLAFLHEFGEGNDLITDKPAGLTNHSALRGVGKDARDAFELVKDEEGLPDPEELIKKLNGKMKRPLTDSEEALIRYNAAMRSKPGFDKCFSRFGVFAMLMGFQDRLDPYSNMAFSEGLKDNSDDIRGDVMNIVISRTSLFQSAVQENWARKTERKFKRIGVDTLFRGYNDVEGLKKAVDDAIKELTENADRQPYVYINCLVESAEKPGEEYDEIQAYIKGKYPEFMERIILQKDVSAEGSGVNIDEFNVDVLKVISFGSVMLNDKRLSKFASFDDEALVASRKRLVEFMKRAGMFKGNYFEDVVQNTYFRSGNEAENYQAFMTALLKGDILVRLTPIDINDIAEYNASLEEVYRSL